jgi:predicted porin
VKFDAQTLLSMQHLVFVRHLDRKMLRHTDRAVTWAPVVLLITVGVAWRQFKIASAKQVNTLVAAVVPFGEGRFLANLSGTVGATNIDPNDANQLAVGYVHSLSKRTALYTTYSRIDNEGGARFAAPGGVSSPTAGGGSSGFDLGVRHTF